MPFTVEELYVFVEILEDGREAIVQTGTVGPNRTVQIVPLITANNVMADKMKDIAQKHANQVHRKIRLLKLSTREDIETIEEQLVQEPNEKDQAWYQ